MSYFVRQSAKAQAEFANLQTAAQQAALSRTIGDLPGSFTTKCIRGATYWYYQFKDASRNTRQIYLGPESSPATMDFVQKGKNAPSSAQHLKLLSQVAQVAGCYVMPRAHGSIIKRLADHAFFHAGGVLIGTHAFLAYQNMLGLRWAPEQATMTNDMDFAHPGNKMSIAIPSGITSDTHEALKSLEMGFLPNAAGTTYVKADEADLQLDFVTCRTGKDESPIECDALNVKLQPLRFMELSMEGVLVTVVMTPSGPVVVNVPAPERFALHKLLIVHERPAELTTKRNKDLDQVACLFSYFEANDPETLSEMAAEVRSYGRGWASALDKGLTMLQRAHPQIDVGLAMQAAPTPRPPGG